ncbi:MAG: hypothetical protein WCE44_14705 [Candidatus Velthaea sp.]
MSQYRPPRSRGARIAAALRELALLAGIIVLGVAAGRLIAPLVGVHNRTLPALAGLLAYVFAALPVGVGFLLRRLPQRIVLPLGSPLSWLVLGLLGSIVGVVVLPFVVLWRLAAVPLAFASAREVAAPAPVTLNVLVDRRGDVRLVGHDDEPALAGDGAQHHLRG